MYLHNLKGWVLNTRIWVGKYSGDATEHGAQPGILLKGKKAEAWLRAVCQGLVWCALSMRVEVALGTCATYGGRESQAISESTGVVMTELGASVTCTWHLLGRDGVWLTWSTLQVRAERQCATWQTPFFASLSPTLLAGAPRPDFCSLMAVLEVAAVL